MDKKTFFLILFILLLGISYALIVTSNGNFTFNTDIADDMVNVREMIILRNLRLIGNEAGGIDGLFYGPGWHYLLAIPFIIFSGDPYGVIIMQIILWAIGGYFLLKLVSKWGLGSVLVAGSLWMSSHYIVTAIRLAFSPNPVIFLTPVFIFFLLKYVQSGKLRFSIGSFLLGGFFFNCEMAFGLFVPIIIAALTFILNKKLFRNMSFWIGLLAFFLWLTPQILFDLRHNFLLSKAIFTHLNKSLLDNMNYNLLMKINIVTQTYYAAFRSALMNVNILVWLTVPSFVFILLKTFKEGSLKKERLFLLSLLIIIIPLIGQVISPARMMLWHTVGLVAVIPIIVSYLVYKLRKSGNLYYVFSLAIIIAVVGLSIDSLSKNFRSIKSMRGDPAFYKNEIEAIDYVYKVANGQNFKVYTYLPSVYDYPYQYLFWWYGQKKYGYIPGEYVYSPNKPPYIPSQDEFQGRRDNLSGLVFLIKEPDRIKMRQAWENDFKDMEFVSKEMVGPIEIEIRKEMENEL